MPAVQLGGLFKLANNRSPTFFVGDEIFFSKDRLRQVEDEIGAQYA